MDFFSEQERALKRSKWLFALFLLGVVGVIFAVYFPVAFFLVPPEGSGQNLGIEWWDSVGSQGASLWDRNWIQWDLFFAVAIGVLGIVTVMTLWKSHELSAGGAAHVAESMGGREVLPDTRDFRERVLRNVVEEMSLASGSPTPRIFIMPTEASINAFAASTNPRDAVVGVTRGALEKLSRDELQGVMAHEMSHIVHGDSRLNVQMISLVFGILGLTILGRLMLEFSWRATGSRRDGIPIALALLVGGLLLIIVGWLAVLFGRILQAAINRQREFLADASAVQYTRNPSGICGALKKIGGYSSVSKLGGHANDSAHLMFADPISHWFGSLLASHPPLQTRIRKLDPSFKGVIDRKNFTPAISRDDALAMGFTDSSTTDLANTQATTPPAAGMSLSTFEGEMVLPRTKHIYHARAIRQGFENGLRDAISHPAGAAAVCYLLILSRDPTIREKQNVHLAQNTPASIQSEMNRLQASVDAVPRDKYLCLVDLAIPGLRGMSVPQTKSLVKSLDEIIHMDGVKDLFEFALEQIIRRHVLAHHLLTPPSIIKYRPPQAPLAAQAGAILSALAHADAADKDAAFLAFQDGLAHIENLAAPPKWHDFEQCTWDVLEAALDAYTSAAPMLKKNLLFSASKVVLSNNNTSLQQWELLRAVADAIDSPMPPLVLENPPAPTAA